MFAFQEVLMITVYSCNSCLAVCTDTIDHLSCCHGNIDKSHTTSKQQIKALVNTCLLWLHSKTCLHWATAVWSFSTWSTYSIPEIYITLEWNYYLALTKCKTSLMNHTNIFSWNSWFVWSLRWIHLWDILFFYAPPPPQKKNIYIYIVLIGTQTCTHRYTLMHTYTLKNTYIHTHTHTYTLTHISSCYDALQNQD